MNSEHKSSQEEASGKWMDGRERKKEESQEKSFLREKSTQRAEKRKPATIKKQ